MTALVVVGASAGGVTALRELVSALDARTPASYLVVLHLAPGGGSVLAQILDRCGSVRVAWAENGSPIVAGGMLVAPPGAHLLVDGERVAVRATEPRHGYRPSIDALFESAAATWTGPLVGIVLSGMLDDGAAGMRALRAAGATTFAEDPAEAAFPALPMAAVHGGGVQQVMTIGAMAAALQSRARMLQDAVVDEPKADVDARGRHTI